MQWVPRSRGNFHPNMEKCRKRESLEVFELIQLLEGGIHM